MAKLMSLRARFTASKWLSGSKKRQVKYGQKSGGLVWVPEGKVRCKSVTILSVEEEHRKLTFCLLYHYKLLWQEKKVFP